MKSILPFLLLYFSVRSFAQQAESCSCTQNLDALVEVAQKRYAGYDDKINTQTSKQYEAMLQKLHSKAQNATGWSCSNILEEYVAFFKDKHFSVNTNAVRQDGTTGRYPAVMAPENIELIEKNLSDNGPHLPVEGIWHDADRHYTIVIYKSGESGQLTGAVLKSDVENWKKAAVKFRLTPDGAGKYKATYYARDFKPSVYSASLSGDLLRFSQWGGTWLRSEPRFTDQQVINQVRQQLSLPNLTFQSIDKDFCYLKISSFSIAENAFDQILKENREVISRTPTLILDLRGNSGGGGSLDTFGEFLRLAYTQPFISSGTTVKVSAEMLAENIAQLKSFEEGYATFVPPAHRTKEDILSYFKSEVTDAEKNMGKLVSSAAYTYKLDTVLNYPTKIALIIDDRCASTTELLIDLAKQSKKVTLFGTHSMGVMDYGGVRPFDLPCKDYTGYVAPARSDWALHGKIDNVGFTPDIPIPASEVDWVQFVRKYYLKHTPK